MTAESLTPREREVVEMVIQGYNNLAIACHMGISEVTVKQHLYSVFGKYGINSRLDLAVTVLNQRHKLEIQQLQTASDIVQQSLQERTV